MSEIIGNINDPDVTSAPPASTPTPVTPATDGIIGNVNDPDVQTQQEHFSTPGQQILGGAESLAQGVIGPLAPAWEKISGLTTGEDIRGRQEALGAAAPLLQGVGLVGSSLIPGLGEFSLAGNVGKIGEVAATGAANLGRIASTGIRAGAEMAALQTSDELSKVITQDPNQTLQTAAINIGLSGIIGGAGGAIVGSISPLWNKSINKMGVEKLATDFMGETQAIQDAGGDPVTAATSEIQGRMDEANNMRNIMSESKPEVLAKAMPEDTPANAVKINQSIQNISDQVQAALNKAAASVKTKNAVPYLNEDLMNFQSVVTDPTAGFADKFLAANKLKTTLEGYAKWGEGTLGATEESSAKGALGRTLSNIIRPTLEDTKIWGAAGDVQRVTNEATTDVIRATKDFKPQITTNTMGENQADAAKLQTLLNQTNAGKISRKANVVGQYLDSTQKQADAITKVHLNNGLENPLSAKLNPTPILDHALNTKLSPGVILARWANNGGLAAMAAKSTGELAGGAAGAGLGALVGHPLVGGWMGEKVLSPIFSALAKPLAENAIDSSAAKASVDYLGNFIRGSKSLATATGNLLRPGIEVLTKDMIPNQESRDRLQKSLDHVQNPNNMMQVGGNIAHLLPQHGVAAASTAAMASQYLNNLKPKQPTLNPFDTPAPIDKNQQDKYNRALDIAQQPLMVLKHVKDGTLLPQDITTLQTIYPNLHSQMCQQISNELIKAKTDKVQIPYSQRVGLSNLMGAPMDSTMSPMAMQSIMASSMAQQAQRQGQAAKQKPATAAAMKSIDKVNSLYQTPLEARMNRK